jgi:hypothetical protein
MVLDFLYDFPCFHFVFRHFVCTSPYDSFSTRLLTATWKTITSADYFMLKATNSAMMAAITTLILWTRLSVLFSATASSENKATTPNSTIWNKSNKNISS